MAAPIVVPFNNNPASTSVKTTSYTIPAGKYAKVKGWFVTQGTATNVTTYTPQSLTIDGVSVFFETGWKLIRTTQSTATACITVPVSFNGDFISSISFTNNTGGTVNYSLLLSGFAVGSTSSLTTGASGNQISSGRVAGGSIFTVQGVGASSVWSGTIQFSVGSNKYFEAWVPSGTVISGSTASSFNWIVEEYNQIS